MKQRRLRYVRMKVKQTSRFGKRCREYMAGCVICDGWRFYDELARFPWTSAELYAFSRAKEQEAAQ